MENGQAELYKIYDSMRTDALLKLHAEGGLTEDAYQTLESVLTNRAVPVPGRPVKTAKPEKKKITTLWTARFAAVGACLPLLCIALDFEPHALMKLCELCWPTAFMLLAANGHYNLAIYAISIAANAIIWAGTGWLIGYGLSARH